MQPFELVERIDDGLFDTSTWNNGTWNILIDRDAGNVVGNADSDFFRIQGTAGFDHPDEMHVFIEAGDMMCCILESDLEKIAERAGEVVEVKQFLEEKMSEAYQSE